MKYNKYKSHSHFPLTYLFTGPIEVLLKIDGHFGRPNLFLFSRFFGNAQNILDDQKNWESRWHWQ